MSWTPMLGDTSVPEGLRSIKNNEIWLSKIKMIAFYDHGLKRWRVYDPKQGRASNKLMPKTFEPLQGKPHE